MIKATISANMPRWSWLRIEFLNRSKFPCSNAFLPRIFRSRWRRKPFPHVIGLIIFGGVQEFAQFTSLWRRHLQPISRPISLHRFWINRASYDINSLKGHLYSWLELLSHINPKHLFQLFGMILLNLYILRLSGNLMDFFFNPLESFKIILSFDILIQVFGQSFNLNLQLFQLHILRLVHFLRLIQVIFS
jgi:hypothetical protein